MLDKFMTRFTQELELEESLTTEVPGVYGLPLDEATTVFITEIPLGFTLFCACGDCPEHNAEEFYTHALTGNLYGEGTDGCVLGIDAEGKKLILSRKIDYPIDYQEFRDIVEDFLNTVDFWVDEAGVYGIKVA